PVWHKHTCYQPRMAADMAGSRDVAALLDDVQPIMHTVGTAKLNQDHSSSSICSCMQQLHRPWQIMQHQRNNTAGSVQQAHNVLSILYCPACSLTLHYQADEDTDDDDLSNDEEATGALTSMRAAGQAAAAGGRGPMKRQQKKKQEAACSGHVWWPLQRCQSSQVLRY
ncbi:hypothetical protein COO60DRAFT_1549473, partial [Scenedesmus sp. NREL 46B-D3]